MKNSALLSALFLICGIISAQSGRNAPATDRVILKFKNESPAAKTAVDRITMAYKGETLKRIPLGKNSGQAVHIVRFPSAADIQNAIVDYTSIA